MELDSDSVSHRSVASFTSTVVVAVVTFATVGVCVCVKNGKILFPENIEIELKVF